MASTLLAGGKGCSPDLALRMYNAVATARTLYAVPLVALRPAQWDTLDTDHRSVVRRLFGLPRTSPVGPTLSEAGQTSLSLRAKSGNPLRPLPRAGLSRPARAFLLRLRTDCARTAERLFHLSGNGSPSCAQCPAEETLEHILLQCPGYDDQRRQLFGVYGRLALPH
ncbi:hypothetical protein MTO96_051719, partial [Rhipicephalus appendiculatus]